MAVEKRERKEEHKTWEDACGGEKCQAGNAIFLSCDNVLYCAALSVSIFLGHEQEANRRASQIIHSMYQSFPHLAKSFWNSITVWAYFLK